MADQHAFRIELSDGATRDLGRLPPDVQRATLREIQRWLSTHPFRELKTRVRRLAGIVPPLYRLRIGDYRAYYRIIGDRVVVLAILHKKDGERWLREL